MNGIIDELLYRYRRPRNRGKLEGRNVVEGAYGNPGCGDTVKVYLRVEEGRVVEARFEGEGCTVSQSTADLLMERITGKPLEELSTMEIKHVMEIIGGELVRMRPKCSTVALSAVKVALRKLKGKSPGEPG